MTLEDIVRDWLLDHGYDGLCYPEEECGCGINDLMPCGQPSLNCVAGHRIEAPEGSDVDYFIYPGLAKQKGRETKT